MKRVFFAKVLLAWAILVGIAHNSSAVDVTACYEDMACWDCHTMGNLRCG